MSPRFVSITTGRSFGRAASGGLAKIGTTTYDATGFGPVTSISDFESTISAQLPSDGFLKYTIKRAGTAGSNTTITTRFKKNGSELCQSAFIFAGGTIYPGNTSTIYGYGNDDHDTLVMQGDGTGVLSRSNTNSWQGQFDRFREAGSLLDSGSMDQAFLYSPSGFIQNSSQATLIAFPQTNSNFWYNTSGSYRLNDFSSRTLPTGITSVIGSGTVTNSIMTMSDGVNSFMIYRYGSGTAVYIEVDLETGFIYKWTTKSFSASLSNGTEEDANGSQLFALNAANSYHAGGTFYYNQSLGWRWSTNLSPVNSVGIGNSTQTDMDVFGSIGSDNYVWFADWGHDDGGLFGVGNDSTLGVRKTYIYKTPSTYVD